MLPSSIATVILALLLLGQTSGDAATASAGCDATLVVHGISSGTPDWFATPPGTVLGQEKTFLGDMLAVPVFSPNCGAVSGTVSSASGDFAPTSFEVPADVFQAGGIVEIEVQPAPGWNIRVVDADGGSIPNAKVRPWMIARDLTVRTDEDGVASGSHGTHSFAVIRIVAEGYRTQFARFPEDPTPVEVRLQATEPFEVTFEDPPHLVTESAAVGSGLFKAECRLEAPGRFVCPETGAWPQQVVVRCGGGTGAAAPRFVFAHHGLRPPFIWCGSPEPGAPEDDRVDPPPPWSSTDLKAELRVRVLTADGDPASGWAVSAGFFHRAKTDESGRATLSLPFADAVLFAGPQGERTADADQVARVRLRRDDWTSPLELRAERICQHMPSLEPNGVVAWVQSTPTGSAVWKSGLRPGDQVHSIAGQPVVGLDRAELGSLLFLPVGTAVSITGARWDGEPAEWSWTCE